MTKKPLIEDLIQKTSLIQNNEFISSINSCLKFPNFYYPGQEVISKIEKALQQNTFGGSGELFSGLDKINGIVSEFDGKGLLQGIRENAELISSLYPFNKENDIAYLKLETDKESNFLRIYRDAFGIPTYEVIENFDNCSNGVFEFSRGLQSFPNNLYEPEVDPLDKLLEYAELMDFIENIGGDKSVKVELYDLERDRWSRGEFIPCEIEGNSRTKVRRYDLKDFHFPTKKYYKKECKTESGKGAEIAGVEGLGDIVRTPNIRDDNGNLIYFDEIKGPSLFNVFEEINKKYESNEYDYGEKNIIKRFYLESLMMDVSDIFIEGTKRQVPSFYGNLTGDHLEGWYRNSFSNLLLKKSHTKNVGLLVKDMEDFAVKNLKELDNGLLVYNSDPHPRNVIVGMGGLHHIDFESSCYTGMQFDLSGILSYEELNLELKQKIQLLNFFIDYTNRNGKIIGSKDEFIDKYFKVEFARNLKSSVSRNEWAKQHQDKYLNISVSKPSDLKKYDKQILYSLDHLKQALSNPLYCNNFPIKSGIIAICDECF